MYAHALVEYGVEQTREPILNFFRRENIRNTFKRLEFKATVYKVFISSTYRDNETRRKIVRDAITMAGMVWHGMELFTASDLPTVECLRLTEESDLLFGIIAWYG